MQDETFFPLGCLDGTEVGVHPTLDGQDILIEHSDTGQSLACLLPFGKAEIARRGESLFWRIPRNDEVDGILMELIDLSISIRHAHPTLVQLELKLDDPKP